MRNLAGAVGLLALIGGAAIGCGKSGSGGPPGAAGASGAAGSGGAAGAAGAAGSGGTSGGAAGGSGGAVAGTSGDSPDDGAGGTAPGADAGADAADADGAPPRPAGCESPDALTSRTIATDGFEEYPIGIFEFGNGSPWQPYSPRGLLTISDAVAAAGAQSLLIQSFYALREVVTLPLPLDRLPARLSVSITFFLDAPTNDQAQVFTAWGFGGTTSSPTGLQFGMVSHDLTLFPGGGKPQVGLFSGLEYGHPARAANVVRVDLDLCTWTAAISVGTPTSPLALRATVDVAPFAAVDGLWFNGGESQTFIDEIRVDVWTP